VSKIKILVLVAFVVALTALAVIGAGWKWRGGKVAAPQEHVAGWTWETHAAKHD
jgi:hypothetical protein